MMELVFIVVALQLLVACHGQDRMCNNEVSISPASQAVRIGDNVSITCHLTNLESTNIFAWYFLPLNSSIFEFAVQPAHPHRSAHQNTSHNILQSTLLITGVRRSDFGHFRCEKISDSTSSCFSNRSVLELFEGATVTITPNRGSGFTGETLNFTTVVGGNPLPTTIIIEKRDVQSGLYVDYPKTKYITTSQLRSISILGLSLEDNGEYRACVENLYDTILCKRFTIVVKGLELIPPVVTIKNGSSLSVVCRVINYDQADNSEMTWETTSVSALANDPLVQITQHNASDLHLYVGSVTKPVAYSCVLRSSSGAMISQYVRVTVTDVPSPPRNLDISATSDGLVTITWKAPETDNFSPLTAYYVNVTVEGGNSTVIRVPLGTTSTEYIAKCKVINVTVTSENACGNSTAVESSIDTTNQCVSSVNDNANSGTENNDIIPAISAGVAVVVVFVGLFVLVMVVFTILFRRQKRNLTSQKDPESQATVKVNLKVQKAVVASSPPPFIKRTTSIRRYRNMLEVPKDSVQLQDYLCDGIYFDLRKGLVTLLYSENKTYEVMVKKAKQSAPSEEEHNIQEEIKMMSSVGIHENVVGLLRMCLSEPPAYLITEYFAHGDLLGFLRASRGHYGMYTVSPGAGYKTRPCSVQGQDLLKMATQIAAGMNYLAEKKVAHRSLCARNVLVGTGLQVKVYNYGPKPNAEANPHNYVKWMAPEMLFDGTATTMSDVWSFAVTVWEIITIGGSPYVTMHPEQMRELLETGHRLPKPDHCANALYTFMEQCWSLEPSARPTFTVLYNQLDTMCKSKLSYLDSSLYREEEYSEFEESNYLMTAL